MAPRRKNKGIGGGVFCHGLSGAVLVTAAAAMFAAPAKGAFLFLSTNSSEPGIDPSLLSATLEFQITGVLQNELTLTITNNTSAPNEFNINRIFFNAGGNVTGLTLTGQPNGNAWELTVPSGPGDQSTHADNFGIFEFMLEHGPPLGHNHHLILPGAPAVFTFAIQGTGPFVDTDFTTELSEQFDSNLLMFAAAKFVQGPGDASAFGGTDIPEPGTVALLGLAGLLGLRRRRRRPT